LQTSQTLSSAVLRGSLGFALTSVAAFSVWAFAGRALSHRLGEGGFYAVVAVVFMGVSGLLLHPLLDGSNRLGRFYAAFIPAFLGYTLAWCAAWFALGFGLGEWLGSLAGCTVFVAILGWRLGTLQGWPTAAVVLFLAHSGGYFLGGELMYWMISPAGLETLSSLSKSQVSVLAKLGWGLLYGLGMGAGLGYACFKLRKPASIAAPE
jgi:hypothetical protein